MVTRALTCTKPVHWVHCVNRFAQSHVDQAGKVCGDEYIDSVVFHIDVSVIGHRIQALDESNRERRL